MKFLDRFFPKSLSDYREKIADAYVRAEETAAAVNQVAATARQLMIQNHLGERMQLAFETKEPR